MFRLESAPRQGHSLTTARLRFALQGRLVSCWTGTGLDDFSRVTKQVCLCRVPCLNPLDGESSASCLLCVFKAFECEGKIFVALQMELTPELSGSLLGKDLSGILRVPAFHMASRLHGIPTLGHDVRCQTNLNQNLHRRDKTSWRSCILRRSCGSKRGNGRSKVSSRWGMVWGWTPSLTRSLRAAPTWSCPPWWVKVLLAWVDQPSKAHATSDGPIANSAWLPKPHPKGNPLWVVWPGAAAYGPHGPAGYLPAASDWPWTESPRDPTSPHWGGTMPKLRWAGCHFEPKLLCETRYPTMEIGNHLCVPHSGGNSHYNMGPAKVVASLELEEQRLSRGIPSVRSRTHCPKAAKPRRACRTRVALECARWSPAMRPERGPGIQ